MVLRLYEGGGERYLTQRIMQTKRVTIEDTVRIKRTVRVPETHRVEAVRVRLIRLFTVRMYIPVYITERRKVTVPAYITLKFPVYLTRFLSEMDSMLAGGVINATAGGTQQENRNPSRRKLYAMV